MVIVLFFQLVFDLKNIAKYLWGERQVALILADLSLPLVKYLHVKF